MISMDQLRAVMPNAGTRLEIFIEPLNAAMAEYEIKSPKQVAAFLAQIALESGECRFVEEIASGHDYEGKLDLGNTEPGDGVRYKGRGLIQLTGRANYQRCGKALGLDLLDNPKLLADPVHACRSAAWFWSSRGLNELADKDSFGAITRVINGGFSAIDSRLRYWLVARKALGL